MNVCGDKDISVDIFYNIIILFISETGRYIEEKDGWVTK